MVETALSEDCGGVAVTPESTLMWRIFGGLGSHDLSVMREAFGMPEKVVGSSLGFPFWKSVPPLNAHQRVCISLTGYLQCSLQVS